MARTAPGITSLKLLFIGNSFAARNDLPGLIAQLAATRGADIRHNLISAGGASLRTHWNAGLAQKAIREGRYDCVVLQEQSTLPLKNAQRMHENMRLFDKEIRTAGAKTLLYMTWARLNALESQGAIADAYTSIGRELGATVVPVGAAWQLYLSKNGQPALHDRDGIHPTIAGTYLAACVFMARLFKKSPLRIACEIPALAQKDQRLLQKIAWTAHKAMA